MGRKSKSEWEALLAAFEGSQQSQSQFCHDHGIGLGGFRKQLQTWRQVPKYKLENQMPESTSFVMVAPPSYPTITRTETYGTAIAVSVGPFTLTVAKVPMGSELK